MFSFFFRFSHCLRLFLPEDSFFCIYPWVLHKSLLMNFIFLVVSTYFHIQYSGEFSHSLCTVQYCYYCTTVLYWGSLRLHCRNIRLIEGNAKCRHLKKLTYKGTLRQVFICLRLRTPYTPLLHILYEYTVYLFTQGRPSSYFLHNGHIPKKYQAKTSSIEARTAVSNNILKQNFSYSK